nr:hypothetical protein Iba_chr02fCG4300 [Ipomoea batatas]
MISQRILQILKGFVPFGRYQEHFFLRYLQRLLQCFNLFIISSSSQFSIFSLKKSMSPYLVRTEFTFKAINLQVSCYQFSFF